MTTRTFGVVAACSLLVAGLAFGLADEAPKVEENAPLLTIDRDGQPVKPKLKSWKFTAGTRKMTWLEPAPKDEPAPAKDKGKGRPAPRVLTGPEALEFRADDSTLWVQGVLTLIPLSRLKSLEFDDEKKTVTVQVLQDKKTTATLTGPTNLAGINRFALTAQVEWGDLGSVELKFANGVADGLKRVPFADPKPPDDFKPGRRARVLCQPDRTQKKISHVVHDLQPLYRGPDGRDTLQTIIVFADDKAIEMKKIKSVKAEAPTPRDSTWEVFDKEGDSATLKLPLSVKIDGKQYTLQGLLSRTPVGYKMFAATVIAEIEFDVGEF